MDSICSEEEGISDEDDAKPDEDCELEEVEEECMEEEEEEEEEERKDKDIAKPQCSPRDQHTPTKTSSTTRSSNERKIILEFGKQSQRSENRTLRSVSHQGQVSSEPRGSIISLESNNKARSRALSVTSKRIEKKIIPDHNIAELMGKHSIRDHGCSSNSNTSSMATLVGSSTESDKLEQSSPVVKTSTSSENTEGKSQHQGQMDTAVSALRAALVADSNHGLYHQNTSNDPVKPKQKLNQASGKTVIHDVKSKSKDNGVKIVAPEAVDFGRSLTDKTLMVVTEKVRQMNSR